jgi:hypothetical protein
MREALGQHGAREAALLGELILAPIVRRPLVQVLQCTTDVVVAQPRKPSDSLGGQLREIAAYHLYE